MADDNNKYYEVVNELNNINESVNEDAEYNNMYNQKLVEYGARHIQDLSPLRKSTFMQEINEWVQNKNECKVKKAKRFGDDLKLTADADRRKNKNVKNALKESVDPARGATADVLFIDEMAYTRTQNKNESSHNFVPVKTPADLKYNVELTGSHFFERSTMKFFGDTMGNYGMRHLKDLNVYELYRRNAVKHGMNKSAYFNDKTFERVLNLEESTVEQNASIQENINRQKEIIEQLLNESPKPEFDTYEADADDVLLIIDNTRKFYDRKLQGFKSLTTKMNRDVYDKELSPRMFTSLAKDAAKNWYDETVKWADDGKSIVKKVTKEVIDKVCSELAKEFEYAYKNKEYDFMEDTKKKKKVDESYNGKWYIRTKDTYTWTLCKYGKWDRAPHDENVKLFNTEEEANAYIKKNQMNNAETVPFEHD